MKIATTKKAITVKAGKTATAKMGKGFLARTTLAAWLGGSLGICSLLFATALELAAVTGLNVVRYGVVKVVIDSVKGNDYCKTIKATATATDCKGVIQTASVCVCYDHNGGNTARKKAGYIPAVKTENGYRIHEIDGLPINWDGCAIDIQ